jgi:hypothetical protein
MLQGAGAAESLWALTGESVSKRPTSVAAHNATAARRLALHTEDSFAGMFVVQADSPPCTAIACEAIVDGTDYRQSRGMSIDHSWDSARPETIPAYGAQPDHVGVPCRAD